MTELPSTYRGDLKHADVLRQLFLHGRALASADIWAQGDDGIALRLRVLRGLKRYSEAQEILESLPESDDTIAMRENRLIVLERLGRNVEFDRLSRNLDVVLARGCGKASRIAVAVARHHAGRGAYRQAERELEQLLSGWREMVDDQLDAVAFGWRLQFLLRLGDLHRARGAADDLIEHWDWRVRATLAAFMPRLDRADEALEILDEVTSNNPGYPTAWRRYVSTLRIVGQFERAEEIALRASGQSVDLPPLGSQIGTAPELLSLGDHPLILVDRAQLELARYDGDNQARLDAARELADIAIATAPHCSEAWWIKARALRFRPTSADTGALREMAKAEAATGHDAVVQVEFANALADATRWDRASEAFQAILSRHPGNREAMFGVLSVLARRTPPVSEPNASDANLRMLRAAVDALLGKLSEDSVMLCLSGERLAQSGHYEMAHELFRTASALCLADPATGHPGNEMSAAGTIRAHGWARTFDKVTVVGEADAMLVRLAYGMVLADRGYFLEAQALCEHLARDYPASERRDAATMAAVWHSNSLRSLYQHDRAQEVVEGLLAVPQGPSGLGMRGADLYDELGCIWLDRNNYLAAQAAFVAALRLAPAHVGALRGMIQVHRALGQTAEASQWVDRAACLHPQDASIRMEQAWLFGECGQFGLAHQALDDVISRDIAQPAALEWRVVYLMREGRQIEARKAAERARLYRPESPSIAETASTVPLQAGDWVTAVTWAREACLRYPNDHAFVIMTASICGLVTKSAQHVPLQAESAEAPITEDITTFVLKGIQERLHSPALDGRPDVATARIRFTRRRLNPLAHDAATHQPPEGVLQAAVRKLKEKVVPGSTAAAPPRAPGEGFVPRDVSDPLQATAEYRMEFAELALLNRRSDVALEELASLYRELPWWTRLVNQYAMTLAMTGQVRSARAVADESVRRFRENGDPCPVELVLLRGELSLRANEYVAALHDAEEAVAHGSRQSMTAQLFRINCYGALGRMDEAYEMASSLIARRPISRKARVGLARALDLAGRVFEAAALMQREKPLFAHDRPSVVMTSWMMRSAGNATEAEEYMLQARRLIPASTGVLGELGWTYLEQQKEIEARQTFGLLKDDLDVTARTLGMTGLLWCDILSATSSEIERKDFREQLESSAKELAKTAVPISEAHFAAAIAYRLLANEDTDGDKRRGHLLAALKQARRATDIDEIAVCHRLLGRILYDLGSVASAKEHLERSIELQPYRGDYAGLGLIHLSQGEHAKALGTIEAGLHRLADGWTADSGFPPTTPQQVDIYAALGATHLDLDLRMGKPADHTMLALRYLRQAVEAEQRHPFAVDNLATALTFTGSSREAVQILRRAIKRITHPPQPGATRHSPARHLERWSDKRDLTALRERLVEVHRTIGARDGMSPMRAREVKQLLREIQAITPDRYKAIQGKLSQDLTDFARVRRNRRWSERAVAALTATGLVWLFDLVNDWHVSTIESIGVGAGLLILFLLVLRLATGIRVKITGLEVDLHLSPSIEMLDLPTRISAHLGFGRFDAARTQWTSIWTSDSRLPQLGPAVGPLIKEYYSHRDQVLPWRRR